MRAPEQSPNRLFLYSCWIYFALGMMVLTTSAVLRTLIAEFHWSSAQGGLLVTLQAMGNLLSSLVGGFFLQTLGRRRSLALATALGVAGFAGITLASSTALAYPFILLTGIFWGISNTCLNMFIAEAFNNSIPRINLLHTSYAVGAVIAPLMASAMISAGLNWRMPVWAVVAALALALLAALRMPIPSPPAPQERTGDTLAVRAFWRSPQFYLGTFTFFAYVGCEVAASSWIATFLYAENLDFQSVPPETMISLMWLLMIVGRLLVASLGGRLNKARLLALEALGFLLGMVALIVFVKSTPLALLSVAFAGLSMSAMYATIVATNSEVMRQSQLVPGLMFAGGGLGAAVMPLLVGLFDDWGGIRAGMVALAVVLGLLVLLALINLRAKQSEAARS